MFQTLKIYLGQKIEYRKFQGDLCALGYIKTAAVTAQGEFAAKGSRFIVYPSSYELPVSIELDDDIISDIRAFNPVTADILEHHRMLVVLPAGLKGTKGESVFSESSPINDFIDVKRGDYVVHIEHGIGRFMGIKKLQAEDNFLIEYAGKDKLYVPLENANLIQKYLGFKGRAVKLSKLGTAQWKKTKEKAKKGIVSFARELLKIQARRALNKGFVFSKDTEWQGILRAAFPYTETADQRKAIEEVKKDMEAQYPMNRLICGDVGYGKTEVALRAAFKAVMDNKQAAILVPTTILAEQHYRRFRERLADFPIRVEMLSRFRKEKEKRAIINDLKNGLVDIIVGTHCLLSSDVKFKDLGLLVIDEEQRFGVIQKEQFQKMRAVVDVLTLTATPIPRTLYMSLVGIKDMSVINTAPAERLPVETFVSEYDEQVVVRAIKREVGRGGQVFFVTNRIKGIEMMAKKIKRLLPGISIAVAHGRMDNKELENIMVGFLAGEIEVLISTSIIQSGIDIPNANTIIVNRADMFGLADLYQLRGRVGRYNVRARAYFLIPRGKPLPQDALRRLNTIAKHTELGSGFKIAMEDMEIRGAGNILGREQHGFIQNIGFDLYCRLLRETIYNLTGDKAKGRILTLGL